MYVLVFIGILLFIMLFSYLKSPLHIDGFDYDSWRLVLWVPAGALVAFVLNQKLGLGPVLGGSITGFTASCLPRINKQSVYLSRLPEVIYCGAFIGMSTPEVANGFTFVIIAAIITAFFLMFSKNFLYGVGGKLGTLAFLGVVIASFIYQLLNLWSFWY
ncbi:hypothetical protein ED312_04885 [Sinomicrobium pectinilyticum]|uniref:Uncharacterized protein n=2 Tax=Sinomicrobium pectinilyticum TaxID=1084421 RepID=A0A3N0EUB7_SINP1|nr:hypothetical protein ED312_04885 [Sinomicrobium pectinilyticum]